MGDGGHAEETPRRLAVGLHFALQKDAQESVLLAHFREKGGNGLDAPNMEPCRRQEIALLGTIGPQYVRSAVLSDEGTFIIVNSVQSSASFEQSAPLRQGESVYNPVGVGFAPVATGYGVAGKTEPGGGVYVYAER
jgi:hypothetical protein